MKIIYTEPLSGNCPIQAEGITPCGLPWYFRARDTVSLTVGTGQNNAHPIEKTFWEIDDDDGRIAFDSPHYPGWAEHEPCEKFIRDALTLFYKQHPERLKETK